MFPVGDDNVRGSGLPIVNIALIAINVVVFLYEVSLNQAEQVRFITTWGVIPTEILNGQDTITLLTSMFLHGGWLHLIGNMLFLWVFGDNIEAVLGHIPYLIFYLLGGLAASAAHIFLNPGSDIPSVGASGAISAILGSYLVLFPNSRIRVLVLFGFRAGITSVTAIVFLGIWAVTQLFSGVASLSVPTAQTSGVAFWAHIGGFVAGLLGGFLLKSRVNRLLPTSTR